MAAYARVSLESHRMNACVCGLRAVVRAHLLRVLAVSSLTLLVLVVLFYGVACRSMQQAWSSQAVSGRVSYPLT